MSFSKFWNKSIWRLLRPTQVVRSVVTAVRVATHRLSTIPNIVSVGPTIATGKQYIVASVPLSAITQFEVKSASGTVATRYHVTGLPTGAILIGKSPDGVTAMRFAQFSEELTGYVFREDPTKYGVVSTRGEVHCTFCVCVGKPLYLDDQDISLEFCRSTDDATVKNLDNTLGQLREVNGISGTLLHLACGATTSTIGGTVDKYWDEGSDLYATVSGELLVSRGRAGVVPPNTVESGSGLVDTVADFTVFANQDKHTAIWMDEDTDLQNLPEYVYAAIPELRYVSTYRTASDLISSVQNQFTYDTTNSLNDAGTQRLLRKYKTVAPATHLTQRVIINTDKDLDHVAYVAIVCSPTEKSTIDRHEDESSLSYLLRCARAGSVVVISDSYRQSDKLYGVTTYARYITRKPTAGSYIHSIVLLADGKNGNPGDILDEIEVKPITVKSGESIAVKVIKR